MGNKINDPIARLMGLRYKSHPWHGLEVGDDAPEVVTAFIEMVPTDTVKYELDKVSGYIKIDRPQKYSNVVPALYGFIPQSYCGGLVAEYAMQQTQRTDIQGDCEKELSRMEISLPGYVRSVASGCSTVMRQTIKSLLC